MSVIHVLLINLTLNYLFVNYNLYNYALLQITTFISYGLLQIPSLIFFVANYNYQNINVDNIKANHRSSTILVVGILD